MRIPRIVVLVSCALAPACVGATGDVVAVEPVAVTATVAPTTLPPTTLPPTTATTAAPTTVEPTTTTIPPTPADQRTLVPVTDLTGDLASKSIVASGTGYYTAQNMMYRHTISIFDQSKALVATVSDSVDLSAFGIDAAPGVYQGAPVEAAFGPDGRYAYISNYRMYGPGFTADPGDGCNLDEGDPSFVYRLDLSLVATPEQMIDRVYPVGSVPKYVAVSPDGRLLLVSNWCTFDLTIIDLTTETLAATVDLGRHPRGIAITSDSARAYVTVMGGSDIAEIDLATLSITWLEGVGSSPRHLVLSPDDSTLYATLNGDGTVIKIDTATRTVVDSVRTGIAPRSMAMSTDGTALYVVNYESNTMTKLRSSDFEILQELPTASKPIGITYDPLLDEVWVACYSGVIHVFAETDPAG